MDDDLDRIAGLLAADKVGIFPADTIYGLTCIASKQAMDKLFDLKKRHSKKPFLMLLPGLKSIEEWVEPLSSDQYQVLKKYWPGPFTFIFKKRSTVDDIITAGKSTIAVRVPDFQPVIDLLGLINQPLLSTSINISGQGIVESLDDVDSDIMKKIDFCVDHIKPIYGAESTLVDLSVSPFKVIRQGVKPFNE